MAINIDSDNISYKEPTPTERIQNDIKWNMDSLYRCFGSILSLDEAAQATLLSDLNQKLAEFQSKVTMVIPI